jgi:hypothetical protein
MVNGEIKEKELEIKKRIKLNEIFYELLDSRVQSMHLAVDDKGVVYVEYVRYYKKPGEQISK